MTTNTEPKNTDQNQQGRGQGHKKMLIGLMTVFFLFWIVLPVLVPGMGHMIYLVTSPFRYLGVFVHEMGHGLSGAISGGSFLWFQMDLSGGVALTNGGSHAAILLGGLLGPAIFGSLLLIASTKAKNLDWTYLGLLIYFGSGVYYILKPVWLSHSTYPDLQNWQITNLVALLVPVLGAGSIFLVQRFSDSFQRFFLQFLGILMCYSAYSDTAYIFHYEPLRNGMFSDARVFASLFWPGGPETVPFFLFVICSSAISLLNFGLMALGVRKALQVSDSNA